jgi:pimeloyl-ACP methyl ester carboxylesterase
MSEQKPAVVLVHGAFAESASWNGVIEQLQAESIDAVAVANPLRSVTGDAAYVRDVIAGIGRPVVLVGHSYGGMVITEAALTEPLPTQTPAWKTIPAWFVISDQDRNIPVELHRFFAERAGSRGTREIQGASHALSVSQPGAVATSILEAIAGAVTRPEAVLS